MFDPSINTLCVQLFQNGRRNIKKSSLLVNTCHRLIRIERKENLMIKHQTQSQKDEDSSELILSSLQLVFCCVVVVKCIPVHHQSADYIFWSFGVIGLIPSQFENRVPLKLVLGGLGSGAP